MPFVLLLPAGAAVLALGALTLAVGRLDVELIELRRSLRRAGAAAVATTELRRTSAQVSEKAAVTSREARSRLRRPRLVGPSARR